jgi:hypothetical protein
VPPVIAAEAVGAGSWFALAPGKGLLVQREHACAQLVKPLDWLADTDLADAAAVADTGCFRIRRLGAPAHESGTKGGRLRRLRGVV